MCSLWIVNYKHKFIIAINYFFLLLAVFRFILNKLPLNDIKYQLCYLKRCLYTQKFYLFIVTRFFFIITCSFSVFFENCILLPKGIDEFVVFLCIVHVWLWFFILLPRFLLLVIKGQFFPTTTILFQSAFLFSGTKMYHRNLFIRIKYTLSL
jgi:hypothetical protein